MAANEVYLVAYDHPNHNEFVVNDDLLMMVIKGQQTKVLEFDFKEGQNIVKKLVAEELAEVKAILDFKQIPHNFEEDRLQREYSYFYPNREFTGKYENEKFKKVDDGTFVDNGYR